MNTIESIVSCGVQMVNSQEDTLTIKGDIYTVYSRPAVSFRYRSVLVASDKDYPDMKRVKQGIPLYEWSVTDKNGNKVKTYKSRSKITDEFITEFFKDKPDITVYNPGEYHSLRLFKELFYNKVCSNMKTYNNMGFNSLSNNPDDFGATFKGYRYRIAFSENDTGKMITRDRYIIPNNGETVCDTMVKVLCSDYACSAPDSAVAMMDNLEYMLNGKYVGVYRI